MSVSPCSNFILTGGYNKTGHILDIAGSYNESITANFDMKRGKTAGTTKKYNNNKKLAAADGSE